MNKLLRGRLITPLVFVALVATGILFLQWSVSRSKGGRLSSMIADLRLRAAQGDTEAQYRLGEAYFHGSGVDQDLAAAFDWYQESANHGNPRGLSGLANMYYLGRGVPQNYVQAAKLFQIAANGGEPHGENGLALTYVSGRGVPQDYSAAYRSLRKAADQGYAKAEYNLGNLYFYGHGIEQNRDEAKSLYEAAASQGDVYALRVLGGEVSSLKTIFMMLQFLAGIWLALHFALVRSSEPPEVRSAWRVTLVIGAGILGAVWAAFDWYGYMHNKVHYLSYGIDTFNAIRWILYVILITMLVLIVSLTKKQSVGRLT